MDNAGRQFYLTEMNENDKLYISRHWDLTGPHGGPLRTTEQQRYRPNVVENLVFALVEGQVAEFAEDIDLIDFPVEPTDDAVAEVMTDLKQFIKQKNILPEERLKFNRNLFLQGTGVWELCFDPHWTGGRGPNRWLGDIRWQSVHPRNLIPDARCGDNLQDGRRVHKAMYVTLEYIRERWPEAGKKVQGETVNTDYLGDNTDQGTLGDDAEQVLLVATWYKGAPLLGDDKGAGLHLMWWAGESNPVLLEHAAYVYWDPGEDARFPFVMRQRYPRVDKPSVFGYGEAYFLKMPQIVLNKTSELILESHMHHALGRTMHSPGAVNPKQKKQAERYGTIPGVWLEVDDPMAVKTDYGQGAPASLSNETQRQQRQMETIIGRFDISQGRTPGSITAFRALDLLNQRAQVRLRTADVAIRGAEEECGALANHLISRFYTEERAYRIIGFDEGRPSIKKRGVFRASQFERVYDVETGAVYSLDEAAPIMEEHLAQDGADPDRFETFFPEMDVVSKASKAMPSDRIVFMEMAKELYSSQLIDAETFWYVIERGKFPPWEELRQKIADQQAQAQAAAEAQAQAEAEAKAAGQAGAGAPVAGQAPAMPDYDAILAQLPDDVVAKIAALPPEEQAAAIESLMAGQVA